MIKAKDLAELVQSGTKVTVKISDDLQYASGSNPAWIVKPQTYEKGGLFKYVRFADGKVLFTKNEGPGCASHKDVVDCGYGTTTNGKFVTPPAVSAGSITIRVNDKGIKQWYISYNGSSSAHLYRLESDEKYIQKELGEELQNNTELSYC